MYVVYYIRSLRIKSERYFFLFYIPLLFIILSIGFFHGFIVFRTAFGRHNAGTVNLKMEIQIVKFKNVHNKSE